MVFDSVSRMSRNAEEGFALYEDLYHKGIRLVFLNFAVTHGGWSLTETFKRKQGEIRGNKNPH